MKMIHIHHNLKLRLDARCQVAIPAPVINPPGILAGLSAPAFVLVALFRGVI